MPEPIDWKVMTDMKHQRRHGGYGATKLWLGCLVAAFMLVGLPLPGLTAGIPTTTEAETETEVVCALSGSGPNGLREQVNAADSTAFATAWLPAFARLTAAIPTLSPHQERWLEEETNAGASNPQRWSQAMSSREASLQKARESAVALETLMRSITVERDNAVLIRRWLEVIRVLVESEAPHHLTRLVAEKVIPREALPEAWGFFVRADDLTTLRLILMGRDHLISNIILCTLPSLGIGDTWTMPPLPIPTPAD